MAYACGRSAPSACDARRFGAQSDTCSTALDLFMELTDCTVDDPKFGWRIDGTLKGDIVGARVHPTEVRSAWSKTSVPHLIRPAPVAEAPGRTRTVCCSSGSSRSRWKVIAASTGCGYEPSARLCREAGLRTTQGTRVRLWLSGGSDSVASTSRGEQRGQQVHQDGLQIRAIGGCVGAGVLDEIGENPASRAPNPWRPVSRRPITRWAWRAGKYKRALGTSMPTQVTCSEVDAGGGNAEGPCRKSTRTVWSPCPR